jgi:hypothetical protein
MSMPRAPFLWATAIISSAVVVICAFALIAYLKAADGVKDTAEKVAERFTTGRITHTFIEEIPHIYPTKGDVLELATARSEETFRKSDSKRYFWGAIDLGTTDSEIRLPVTFRYHLLLSDTWRLAARTNVCIVLAPAIRPSQPPAIHTQEMEKYTSNGWARFNANENLDDLERSITAVLEQRAGNDSHLRLVREACRQSVAEFVKSWLLRDGQWKIHRFTSVIIVFPDEAKFETDEQLQLFQHAPTITLGQPHG